MGSQLPHQLLVAKTFTPGILGHPGVRKPCSSDTRQSWEISLLKSRTSNRSSSTLFWRGASLKHLNETASVWLDSVVPGNLHWGEKVACQHAAGNAMNLAPSQNTNHNPALQAGQRSHVRFRASVRTATF